MDSFLDPRISGFLNPQRAGLLPAVLCVMHVLYSRKQGSAGFMEHGLDLLHGGRGYTPGLGVSPLPGSVEKDRKILEELTL